jgi:hypothetical protein
VQSINLNCSLLLVVAVILVCVFFYNFELKCGINSKWTKYGSATIAFSKLYDEKFLNSSQTKAIYSLQEKSKLLYFEE